MKLKSQKGFTLIELLVVVAILGAISAVAIPNLLKFIGHGENEAAMAEQHNLQVAVTAYLAEDGDIPAGGVNVAAGSDGGIFAPYFINTLGWDWWVSDANAEVFPVEGNPLYDE